MAADGYYIYRLSTDAAGSAGAADAADAAGAAGAAGAAADADGFRSRMFYIIY
jgi:hypothetical protein